MVTPLASIFGSGFLVIVSVLGGSVGPWSVPAMAGVCALAYAVGAVVRFNIRHAEPKVEGDDPPRALRIVSTLGQAALILAYVISITLYLRILSSYALGFFGSDRPMLEKLLTTGVLAAILAIAWTRGLEALEAGEKWALAATVAIMLLLIGAFGIHDVGAATGDGITMPTMPSAGAWHVVTVLAGTLIVVQGFETTRYLGDEFNTETRVRASRDAQIVSTIVYLLFVACATPLMHLLSHPPADNALMHLAGSIGGWLTVPLVLVAVFSQFSAAVADAISGSGSLIEVSRHSLSRRMTYLLICLAAVALCWATSTFTILALASRAFAFYYLVQCVVAIMVADGALQRAGMAAVGLALAFVTVFATPVG